VIAGTVTDEGVPGIMLPVAGQVWPGIIDTGFNGDLELPAVLRSSLNTRFIGRMASLLAGGQSIEEDVYLVDVPFDDRTVRAEATFVAGREILIGPQLLRQYRLEIHFPARTVLLELVS
jgi:predicted aspartyl protease